MKCLKRKINRIGKELVKCNICKDVNHDFNEGILPRCLILDESKKGVNGCVVIGMNPGKCREGESGYYLKNGKTYDLIIKYWKDHIKNGAYYKKLDEFIRSISIKGPILWSELVKCENIDKTPSQQTFRTCVERYLNKEMKSVPKKWPIFAVGKEAYVALSYLYPKKAVIGIPHPTGSHGDFIRLNRRISKFKTKIRKAIDNKYAEWVNPPG